MPRKSRKVPDSDFMKMLTNLSPLRGSPFSPSKSRKDALNLLKDMSDNGRKKSLKKRAKKGAV